jgi:hypothetical protein
MIVHVDQLIKINIKWINFLLFLFNLNIFFEKCKILNLILIFNLISIFINFQCVYIVKKRIKTILLRFLISKFIL